MAEEAGFESSIPPTAGLEGRALLEMLS